MNLSDEITNLKNWITENFTAKMPDGLSEEHQAIFDTMQSEFDTKLSALPNEDTQLTELTEKLHTISNANSDLTDNNLQLNTENDTLTSSLAELQTKYNNLDSDYNQLKATKTGNPIGADPNVSLNKKNKNEKNDMLNHMPTQLRKQLNKI